MEEWKKIPGLDARYEVSDRGRIRSWGVPGKRGRGSEPRLLMGHKKRGYPYFMVRKSCGSRASISGHRAALLAFVGYPPPNHECRHINGDRSDFRISNLAWGTRGENSADRWDHGTMLDGERNASAKLSWEDAVAIRALLSRGHGLRFVGGLFGVSTRTVARIRDGESWKHAAAAALGRWPGGAA